MGPQVRGLGPHVLLINIEKSQYLVKCLCVNTHLRHCKGPVSKLDYGPWKSWGTIPCGNQVNVVISLSLRKMEPLSYSECNNVIVG